MARCLFMHDEPITGARCCVRWKRNKNKQAEHEYTRFSSNDRRALWQNIWRATWKCVGRTGAKTEMEWIRQCWSGNYIKSETQSGSYQQIQRKHCKMRRGESAIRRQAEGHGKKRKNTHKWFILQRHTHTHTYQMSLALVIVCVCWSAFVCAAGPMQSTGEHNSRVADGTAHKPKAIRIQQMTAAIAHENGIWWRFCVSQFYYACMMVWTCLCVRFIWVGVFLFTDLECHSNDSMVRQKANSPYGIPEES